MIEIEAVATVTPESQVTITVPNHIPPGKHKMLLTLNGESATDGTATANQPLTHQTIQSIYANRERSPSHRESSNLPGLDSVKVNAIDLSVIVPLHNEEPNIDHLFERLTSVLDRLGIIYEIVCVNDGSQDNTLECLIQHHYRNPAIKVVNLSRNFGKEIALTAGIDHAQGKAVIPIDADLQDPPELIEQLVEKWREGYDIVYAQRRLRSEDSWLKRSTAKAFYWTIAKLSPVDIPANVGDFRLLDRRVVDVLKQMPERTRFMKGLFAWVGFKQCSVAYDRQPRYQGQSKWNYWKLWNFALDGITSFSTIPLKVWTYIGFTLSLLSFLYATYLIISTLIVGITLPGYASLMVVVLFLGGIQLIGFGIIGEYLGRIYEEAKQRPLYIVQNCHGLPHHALGAERRHLDS